MDAAQMEATMMGTVTDTVKTDTTKMEETTMEDMTKETASTDSADKRATDTSGEGLGAAQAAGKTVVITAGPTNERIDAVMKITNMATGALGCAIAERLLTGHDSTVQEQVPHIQPAQNASSQNAMPSDPASPASASTASSEPDVSKVIYLTTKMSLKPQVPADVADRLDIRLIESADDLKDALHAISRETHVDAVVHTAAVGDYKGRLSVRAEDVAAEIADRQATADRPLAQDEILAILLNPRSAQDDRGKMSSTMPHLLVELGLTPKVIGFLRGWFPDALLVGCKLLDNVSEEELVSVASRLRQKNRMDYILANDLGRMDEGRHPAMLIGSGSAILARLDNDTQIAETIASLILG